MRLWEAAAKQSGVCLVGNSEELEDLVVAFSFCRPTSGVGTGVVGAGGGRSVESADCCIESGLTLPALPASLINQLRDHSSTLANWIRNPVDGSILIGSGMTEPEILKIMAQSPEFDFLIANVAEFWSMDESDSLSMLNDTVDGFLSVARDTEKPIAFVVGDTVGEEDWQSQALTQIRGKITEAQRPQFAKIHRATKALARLSRYYAALGERGPRMQSKHGRT